MKKAYLIMNIEEYGKFISYCIKNDINVFRTYWDEIERGDRCYIIDWEKKNCSYSRIRYCEQKGYIVVIPHLCIDEYGDYIIDEYEYI